MLFVFHVARTCRTSVSGRMVFEDQDILFKFQLWTKDSSPVLVPGVHFSLDPPSEWSNTEVQARSTTTGSSQCVRCG